LEISFNWWSELRSGWLLIDATVSLFAGVLGNEDTAKARFTFNRPFGTFLIHKACRLSRNE